MPEGPRMEGESRLRRVSVHFPAINDALASTPWRICDPIGLMSRRVARSSRWSVSVFEFVSPPRQANTTLAFPGGYVFSTGVSG
jgi:hypothetical protein